MKREMKNVVTSRAWKATSNVGVYINLCLTPQAASLLKIANANDTRLVFEW